MDMRTHKAADLRHSFCVANNILPSLRVCDGPATAAPARASGSAMAAADALLGAHSVPVASADGSSTITDNRLPQLVFTCLCIWRCSCPLIIWWTSSLVSTQVHAILRHVDDWIEGAPTRPVLLRLVLVYGTMPDRKDASPQPSWVHWWLPWEPSSTPTCSTAQLEPTWSPSRPLAPLPRGSAQEKGGIANLHHWIHL